MEKTVATKLEDAMNEISKLTKLFDRGNLILQRNIFQIDGFKMLNTDGCFDPFGQNDNPIPITCGSEIWKAKFQPVQVGSSVEIEILIHCGSNRTSSSADNLALSLYINNSIAKVSALYVPVIHRCFQIHLFHTFISVGMDELLFEVRVSSNDQNKLWLNSHEGSGKVSCGGFISSHFKICEYSKCNVDK
jgi:hypothetical protein